MTLEINHKIAGVVPMASIEEQNALTLDIRKNGQLEPIVLWQGKIIDGRCRNLACLSLNIEPIIKELPWNTTEEEAIAMVKSLNTRRNLTLTQKIISACRVSLDKNIHGKVSDIAREWGISFPTLKNARYIAKYRPEFIEPLFNGRSVNILNSSGEEMQSNKITTIYAYIKRDKENTEEDITHAWHEDSFINTQKGKEWYYNQIKNNKIKDVPTKMMIAELANYKFKG